MKLLTVLSEFGKKLKPFFNLRVENFEDALSLILGVGVFALVIFQAAYMDLTYDEAYTYMNTGRIQNVWKIYQFRIANTHILNSLLMTVTTLFFPYNDFAIRLPAVLLAGFYISTAISFSKKFQNRLMFLGMLLLFYYFITFLSLARGYGMSAAFLLAAIFVYKNKSQFKEWYLWLANLFLLAMYANYVAIPIILVMSAYIYVFDFKFKAPVIPKKKLRWILGLFILGVYGFFSVTREGKPLYGAYEEGVFEAIPYDFVARFMGDLDMSLQYIVPVTLAFVALVVALFFISKFQNPIGVITIGTFTLIIVMAWLGNKPLPTGRVLLPFWPLVVVSIIEVLDQITLKIKAPKLLVVGINVLVLGWLLFNFSSQTELNNRLVTKSIQWKKPIEILSNYDREIYPHEIYYLRKDRYHKSLIGHLESVDGQHKDAEHYSMSIYSDLGIVVVNLDNLNEDTRIYRTVLKGESVMYEDTIHFKHDIYEVEEDYPVLIAFPNMDGDALRIGAVDQSWNETVRLK